MRTSSKSGSFIMSVVVGLALSGCGAATASVSPAGDGSIAVELSEWRVSPASATGAAGSITFVVSNVGTQVHEFVVVKTETKAADLPVVDNKIDEGALTPVDEIEDIAVGTSPTLTVDLAAGHYVLLCNIESHYEQGMRADFDVE